jgi:chromosome segregation ATPase
MASYKLIRILDVCVAATKKKADQERAGKFVAKDFDADLVEQLERFADDALRYAKESKSLVDTEWIGVEKALKEVNGFFNRKSPLTEAESKKLKVNAKAISESYDKVEEDGGAIESALNPQFLFNTNSDSGWSRRAVKLLSPGTSNKTFMDSLAEVKKAMEDRTKVAEDIEKAVNDCEKSIKELEKKSVQDRGKILAEIGDDLKDSEKLMDRKAKEIDAMKSSVSKQIDALDKLAKAKSWKKDDATAARAALTAITGQVKKLRGAFQTMSDEFDDLLERGMQSPEAAKAFKSNVQNAEKLVNKTEKSVDEFAKDADKYTALTKKIEKEAG